jgi:hypothetical protein
MGGGTVGTVNIGFHARYAPFVLRCVRGGPLPQEQQAPQSERVMEFFRCRGLPSLTWADHIPYILPLISIFQT